MYGRIVKHDALIVVRSAFGNVSRPRKGNAHEAMPNNERDWLPAASPRATGIASRACPPHRHQMRLRLRAKTEKKPEQQQRVFRSLSERFRLVDQQAGLLHRRFGFRRGIAFHVEERSYEGDLKLDLLTTQRGRGGQDRDLVEGARELRCRFDQRRTLKRPLPRFAHKPAAFSICPASV